MARILGRLLAVSLIVGTELLVIRLSWHTLGEIAEALFFLLVVFINAVLVPLALWKPSWGLPPVLTWWALVVSINLFLGVQLGRAKLEARRIVDFAYAHREKTGSFPKDISSYEFRDPWIRDGIYRFEYGAGDRFAVYYGAPGQEDVAHWYDSEFGWGYYPD